MSHEASAFDGGCNAVAPGSAGVSPACGDCGLKPSLSAWKPRRGYGVESWVRGRPRPHARRRRAHLEQTLLICAPEARAPMNLNGARASLPARGDCGLMEIEK